MTEPNQGPLTPNGYKWLKLGLAGMAVAGLAGYLSEQVSGGRPRSIESLATLPEEEIYRQIESTISPNAPGGPFLLKLKQAFPSEYENLLRGAAKEVRATGSRDAVYTYAQGYTVDFVSRNLNYAVHASPDALVRLGSQYDDLIEALAAYDDAACAQFFNKGMLDATLGLKMPNAAKMQLSATSEMVLDAILSGKAEPHHYEPLTDEDWAAMGAAMAARGVSAEQAAMLDTPAAANLSEAELCRIGRAFYASLDAMPPERKAKLVILIAESAL